MADIMDIVDLIDHDHQVERKKYHSILQGNDSVNVKA